MAMSRGEKKSSQGESRLAEATLVRDIRNGIYLENFGKVFSLFYELLKSDLVSHPQSFCRCAVKLANT